MNVTMLKSKLHQARVTGADLHYEGSISIDRNLIEQANLLINEQVDVLNINNGERFTTYVIEGERGTGTININGAAARLVQEGDQVIVIAYADMPLEEAKTFEPTVVILDDNNRAKLKAVS